MKIYARKTNVQQIPDDVSDEFIKKHHRQGLPTYGKARFNVGCYYNNELVGVCSFSNPRTKEKKRNYQQELVRMAFPNDVRVVGGASKMIKFYIDTIKPRSLFTYQTTGGEHTDVYKLAGLTLVKRGRKKQMLVKNGYTYSETLQRSDEKYLFINSQLANLGPDKLLGTSLGEVIEDGRRLTNRELFVKYCDYHIEYVSGDDVYAFENPNYIYYTYRLESSDPNDTRYYIGRHGLWVGDGHVTNEDLMNDGYFGSGGDDFRNWKSSVYDSGYRLIKSIIDTQDTWSDNIKSEAESLDTVYRDDSDCMNKQPGGAGVSGQNIGAYGYGICETHGSVIHRSGYCVACLGEKAQHNALCSEHGMTRFNGRRCLKCQQESSLRMGTCEIHGHTQYYGDTCCKCTTDKGLSIGHCDEHGETKFRGGICLACQVNTTPIVMKSCDTHGYTKFKGESCLKCTQIRQMKICPIHGETKFHGESCVKCVRQASIKIKQCPIHGETKFRGNTCCKCSSAKLKKEKPVKIKKPKKETIVERKVCDICHKEARHINGLCQSCKEQSLYNEKVCAIHGLTRHRGNKCCECRAQKMREERARKKVSKENNN